MASETLDKWFPNTNGMICIVIFLAIPFLEINLRCQHFLHLNKFESNMIINLLHRQLKLYIFLPFMQNTCYLFHTWIHLIVKILPFVHPCFSHPCSVFIYNLSDTSRKCIRRFVPEHMANMRTWDNF